jgi:ribose transport system substrate-binding protein
LFNRIQAEVEMKKRLVMMFACMMLVMTSVFSKDKDINIVFIPKSSDQDFWIFMREGVDKAIRENGNVTLTWRGPAYNDDTDSQIKILGLYTIPGVDAIIIVPTDRIRLVEPVKKALALGIKVIVVDSALGGNLHLPFIATNNVAGGKLAAERLSTLLNGQGKVLLFRTVAGSASTEDRANGFIDYLKKNSPGITIVADEYGGGSRGKAARSAIELLKNFPQVDGIFAVNESASDGMLRALRGAGWASKKKFIGFDSTDFLLDGLEKQEINGLVIQNPRQMGYLGIKAAIAAVKNIPVTDLAKNASSNDTTVFTDATMVTLENYRKPEIQTLLFP